MSQKIAVAVVHGIGKQSPDFANKFSNALLARTRPVCGDDIVVRPVYWSPALKSQETRLWEQLNTSGAGLRWRDLRETVIEMVSDATAYSPSMQDGEVYADVHQVFAHALRELADAAGENAPLCIVSHSLGTLMASNYIYDLQMDAVRPLMPPSVRALIRDNPLELGETLSLFYTLGSPIPMWVLRYKDFGTSFLMPPMRLAAHYPTLLDIAEWVNMYDADDVIGYPLRQLNASYHKAVKRDVVVNVGSLLKRDTPLSHLYYWQDQEVIVPIAEGLIRVWKALNEKVWP
ncbi:MAG: hypothetical protein ACOYL5_00930 [Phototrophicaceae bacterium]